MKLGPWILDQYMFISMAILVHCMVFWRGRYLSFCSCKTWCGILTAVPYLTFERFLFMYLNTCKKNAPKINFVYSGNKEIYCIFRTCCIISVLVSKECHLFHNFTFSLWTCFFINHVPEFKYQPRWMMVKTKYTEVFTVLACCVPLLVLCLATFRDSVSFCPPSVKRSCTA